MHVFVTGGTGFVGSAVVTEFVKAGHSVSGLARNNRAERTLRGLGGWAVPGNLEDLDVLEAAASSADAVVHLAYKHDAAFDDGQHNSAVASDHAAVGALARGLAPRGGVLLVASTMTGHDDGERFDERDSPTPRAGVTERLTLEKVTLDYMQDGVRPVVVRMPPVHGEGDRSFVSWFVDAARRTGTAGYVGSGDNSWPAVYVGDVATLFRLVAENPVIPVVHAVAEQAVPTRVIAEAIGRNLGVPAAPVPADHFGPLAEFARADIISSSVITKEATGWRPVGPSLIADLDQGHYFR